VSVCRLPSRALGAGKRERADELAFHAFLLALALVGIFSAVMLLAAPLIFGWMGGRDKMLKDALSYANVALGGAVTITVLNLLGNVVRGTGNMSLHASVLLGCVMAHIALAPLLIFGYGPFSALGPAGAGWALVIPFGVGSLIMILYLRSPRSIIRLNFRGVAPQWAQFADILKVGVPGLVNTSITNLSVVVLTGIAGQFGPKTAVGYAMGARLEYIMQPVAFGFGTAIVAVVGTNWGAKQYRRARQIAWTGAATTAVLCGTLGLIVALQPSIWLGLFSDDAEVARLGALYLRIAGPAYFFWSRPRVVRRMPGIRPRLYSDDRKRGAHVRERGCGARGGILAGPRRNRSLRCYCIRLLHLRNPDRVGGSSDLVAGDSTGPGTIG
jgi:putative MATE family efflux protein